MCLPRRKARASQAENAAWVTVPSKLVSRQGVKLALHGGFRDVKSA